MTKSLYDLYREKDWDIDKFYSIINKISNMIQCPCSGKFECMHNILPADERVGGVFCANECPASTIWRAFKDEVYGVRYKYFYDGID